MFQPHPSRILNEHFSRKPYQGAQPESARFLFIGLDANYAPQIESSTIFPSLLRYQKDGPNFWRTKGVHHPFMLPQYKGDGRRYHLTFAKIGFQPVHADMVSFIEMLSRPTAGRSALVAQDLDAAHLKAIRRAVFDGQAQFIFVSAGVQRLMASSGMFPELLAVRRTFGALRVLYEGDDRAVFLHQHRYRLAWLRSPAWHGPWYRGPSEPRAEACRRVTGVPQRFRRLRPTRHARHAGRDGSDDSRRDPALARRGRTGADQAGLNGIHIATASAAKARGFTPGT